MSDDNGEITKPPKRPRGRPKGSTGIKKLAPQHRAFVVEYMKNGFNASAAYRKVAGIPDDHRVSYGQRLLKRPDVSAEIERLLEDRGLNPTKVKTELTELAFAEPDSPWMEIPGGATLKAKALEYMVKMTGVVADDNTQALQRPLINLLVENPDHVEIQSVVGLPAKTEDPHQTSEDPLSEQGLLPDSDDDSDDTEEPRQ